MFFTLFKKECKAILKSLTYYIIVVCIVLFYFTNMDSTVMTKPVEGQNDYGIKVDNDKDTIMEDTVNKLARSTYHNVYKGYPFGFYKESSLNDKKSEKVQRILEDVTGLTYEEVIDKIENYRPKTVMMDGYEVVADDAEPMLVVKEGLTYDEFANKMGEVDDLLGGRSDFAPSGLANGNYVPMTYEEALAEYNSIIHEDKITNAYARLFCDYLGIVLGLLPIFLIITRSLRDKRAQVSQVIFSKQVSSANIILSRYLSSVIMIMIPILLLAISPTLESMYYGHSVGVEVDNVAFLTHIGGWLLPTTLFVTALGLFITELTDSALGILVGGLYWIIHIFMSFATLVGSVGWNLIPRFNSLGDHDIFVQIYDELVINRIGYTITSLVLVLITIVIYSKKREGVVSLDKKLFPRRKG